MFLGMQDFDYVQILSLLPKSNHICPNFTDFAQKNLLGVRLHPQLLRHCSSDKEC